MKKFATFTGGIMMLIQFLFIGIYAISQIAFTQHQLNILVAIVTLVSFNLVSISLIIYGLVSE